MILRIDTTKPEETSVLLYNRNGDFINQKIWCSAYNQSEELLSEIEKLLNEMKITKKDLTTIVVNPGPGSYTGQRVGISTANCLAFALNIPIFSNISATRAVNKLFTKPVQAIYSKAPNITKPKPRL